MTQEQWNEIFIETLIKYGISKHLAKFLSKICFYYETGFSPEKSAEIEFNRLYK